MCSILEGRQCHGLAGPPDAFTKGYRSKEILRWWREYREMGRRGAGLDGRHMRARAKWYRTLGGTSWTKGDYRCVLGITTKMIMRRKGLAGVLGGVARVRRGNAVDFEANGCLG